MDTLGRVIHFSPFGDKNSVEMTLIVRTHLWTKKLMEDVINNRLKRELVFQQSWTFKQKVELFVALYSDDEFSNVFEQGLIKLDTLKHIFSYRYGQS